MSLVWAAGLFEGEGCIIANRYRNERVALHLRLGSTDEDVVRRFCEVVGFGSVAGPYCKRTPNGGEAKPMWVWSGSGAKAKELAFREEFFSNLGARRRNRFLEVITLWEANPLPLRRIADDPITGERRYARLKKGQK